MRISCVGGGAAGPACPLSVFVRTPLRALSKRRKRRCNAPALRGPTSVIRCNLHLRRFAPPSDGLKLWLLCVHFRPGLGRPRWPAKTNHANHLIRHGKGIEYFVSAIRSLEPPLWRRFLWSTSGPAPEPGSWSGHAGLPKSHGNHLIRHGKSKNGKSYLARLHSDLSNAAKMEQIEDVVSVIRSLKPPLWRGFLWSTSGPAPPRLPGARGMRGHAGIQTLSVKLAFPAGMGAPHSYHRQSAVTSSTDPSSWEKRLRARPGR
eukprot:gene7778-biopygen3080